MTLPVEEIEDAIEQQQEEKRPESISASRWHECDRKMWLDLRRATPVKIDPRTQRTFGIGHALENTMVEWIEGTGVKVVKREAGMKNQYGTSLGHIDGMLWYPAGDFHLLEMKTAKHKRFQTWMRQGVPDNYFAQVQLYMHHSNQLSQRGNKLQKATFVVVNKDTSELHTEEVEYDRVYAQLQTERIENLIATDNLPSKTESYKCKFCDQRGICLEGQPAQMDCRTCAHVSVDENGQFVCPFGTELCDNYVMHPQLMELQGYTMHGIDSQTFVIDYGDFALGPKGAKHPDKPTYFHSEFQLAQQSGLLHDENVQSIKQDFDATLTSTDNG